MGFPRLVQPILDRKCVACHDGSEGPDRSPLVLTGEREGAFTRGYQGLRPLVRWYEWGPATIREMVTRPGQIGADMSPLSTVLAEHAEAGRVQLTREEKERLWIWLDGNAPFYGTYDPAEQERQFAGEEIAPPELQ